MTVADAMDVDLASAGRIERLPRVTEILKDAGLVPSAFFTDFAREKGTAVHLACQYHDEGVLDEGTLDPAIIARFEGYKRFKAEADPTVLAIEEEVSNLSYGYIGHLDRRLILNGREGVLDIKPPSMAPWHSLQTQFYAMCFDRSLRRWTLHLFDTGRYKLIPHEDLGDRVVVRSIMTVLDWRRRHGL